MTHDQIRKIRRDYIKHFICYPEKVGDYYTLRDTVRFYEIIRYGCQLPAYYKNWSVCNDEN